MLPRKSKVTFRPTYDKRINSNADIESAIKKHDRYLIELEKQKQLTKNLQRKNSTEVVKEELERGFSAYVNGANALPKPKTTLKPHNMHKSNKFFPSPQITIATPRKKQSHTHGSDNQPRRRFWGQDSVEIATDSGAKLYASLRTLNCKYSDDFESDSIDFEKSDDDAYSPKSKLDNNRLRPKSVPLLPNRKFWGQGSVMIKASSGEDLRASISNVTDYSMNFDDDSDSTLTDPGEEIAEEIESDLTASNDFEDSLFVFDPDKPFKILKKLSN